MRPPNGSLIVESTPTGLLRTIVRFLSAATRGRPFTRISAPAPKRAPGSFTTSPSTVTTPDSISAAAPRREATPACAKTF